MRIKQSEATIRAMTKANVKLLKTILGIGEFFARLIDAEIDDISRGTDTMEGASPQQRIISNSFR